MASLGLSLAEAALHDTFKAVNPFAKQRSTNGINWRDYNYPPYLNIFHYDLDDIGQENNRKIVSHMNKVLVITFATCLVNLVDTIVNTLFFKDADGSWIIYSILNFVVIVPIAMYVFYTGFKGLALTDSGYLTRYVYFGTIQAVFYLMFILLHFGALNGLLSFVMFNVGVYWAVSIAIESTLWMIALVLCIYTVLYVHRGDYNLLPVSSQTGGTKNTETGKSDKHVPASAIGS
jgi:hypothetical protein